MNPKKKKQQKATVKPKPVADNKNTIRYLYLIIFAAAFIVYANTFRNGYVLDDFSVIKENWVVKKGTEGISTIMKTSYRYGYWSSADELYRPLSLVMFALEWEFWPDNPKPGHIINVMLYAFICVLLFSTLRKILWRFTVFLPFLTALLFALHPIHTEVVANIKSRDELLSFFFLLFTLRFAFNYIESSKAKWILYGAVSYFLAFMSKESAIVFLAVIPLTLYFFSNASNGKNLFYSGVMVIPALLFLAIRSKVLANQPEMAPISMVDNLLVAAPDYITQLATAIKILGKYMWLLLVPYPLVSDYSFNQIPIEGWGSIWVIISFVILMAMGVFSLWKFKTKNIISYSVLFFFITMSIYSNIVMMIGSSFGERFLFVPSIAFCLILAWGLIKVFKSAVENIPVPKLSLLFKSYRLPFMVLLPVFLIYSVVVFSRNREWESDLIRNTADVRKSPNSAHMRYYYGLVLMKDKAHNDKNELVYPEYLDSAIINFSIAAKIVPTFADAYDQIGLAYYRKQMNDSALKYYEKALKYNPTKSITYSNMGVIYFNNKQFDKAMEVYEKAVKYDPAFSDAWMNLGSTLGTLGKFNEAINAFKKCIEYNPQNAMVHYFIGITYKQIGDEVNSSLYLNKAAQMDPKYAQTK